MDDGGPMRIFAKKKAGRGAQPAPFFFVQIRTIQQNGRARASEGKERPAVLHPPRVERGIEDAAARCIAIGSRAPFWPLGPDCGCALGDGALATFIEPAG